MPFRKVGFKVKENKTVCIIKITKLHANVDLNVKLAAETFKRTEVTAHILPCLVYFSMLLSTTSTRGEPRV